MAARSFNESHVNSQAQIWISHRQGASQFSKHEMRRFWFVTLKTAFQTRMAVLSKAGCNAGQCHGNANGKAGFKLSLRGQDPDWDYKALTRDMFGRRTDPEEADQSLILLKPTTQIAHEGGQRFKQDSEEYQILRAWIAEGMLSDPPNAPTLERLEVSPTEKILFEPSKDIQLRARALFSDGSDRDVTRMAVYDTANSLVKVTQDGR